MSFYYIILFSNPYFSHSELQEKDHSQFFEIIFYYLVVFIHMKLQKIHCKSL